MRYPDRFLFQYGIAGTNGKLCKWLYCWYKTDSDMLCSPDNFVNHRGWEEPTAWTHQGLAQRWQDCAQMRPHYWLRQLLPSICYQLLPSLCYWQSGPVATKHLKNLLLFYLQFNTLATTAIIKISHLYSMLNLYSTTGFYSQVVTKYIRIDWRHIFPAVPRLFDNVFENTVLS